MTTLVLVGGYLGAGKTTLILRVADMLRRRGQRVGVILNDQDSGLVDTRMAEAAGVDSREVAGGCFCCRFGDLLEAAQSLRRARPDVIFAEPAGSCIDIAATVVQPRSTAAAISLAPTPKQEQTVAPRSSTLLLGRPAMTAKRARGAECLEVSCSTVQSRDTATGSGARNSAPAR